MPSLTYDRLQQPKHQTISSEERKQNKKEARKPRKPTRGKAQKMSSNEESVYSRLHVPVKSQKEETTGKFSKSKPRESNSKILALKPDAAMRNLPSPPKNGIEGEIETSEQDLRQRETSYDKKEFTQQTKSSENGNRLRQMAKKSLKQDHISNNVSKFLDTNKVETVLRQMGLTDEGQRFHNLIKHRFRLEEDFIRINQNVGIQTLEGDFDECASKKHSAVGGLKVRHVPKEFIMVDEYDPKILAKNLNVLKDLEKRTIAIHRKCLQEQI
uniref:Uncharacterized protein n=1 Tax=Clytia hemisphaerica TaxID=252671 RepID=A0A7M5V839_9CNID|eukprot:TCONS_00057992-protein